mgnify:CR=1 FL=1
MANDSKKYRNAKFYISLFNKFTHAFILICILSSGYIYNELDYVSTALWLFMRLDPNGKYDRYKHLPIDELESKTRIGFICDDNGVITEGRTFISSDFKYIEKWNTWNGHEKNNQIRKGVDALYKQCSRKAASAEDRAYLDSKYKYLLGYIVPATG